MLVIPQSITWLAFTGCWCISAVLRACDSVFHTRTLVKGYPSQNYFTHSNRFSGHAWGMCVITLAVGYRPEIQLQSPALATIGYPFCEVVPCKAHLGESSRINGAVLTTLLCCAVQLSQQKEGCARAGILHVFFLNVRHRFPAGSHYYVTTRSG